MIRAAFMVFPLALLLVGRLEHFKHAFGDDIAAGRVTRAEQHADETDDLLQRARRIQQRPPRADDDDAVNEVRARRSEEHTSELQSILRLTYAVYYSKKKNTT